MWFYPSIHLYQQWQQARQSPPPQPRALASLGGCWGFPRLDRICNPSSVFQIGSGVFFQLRVQRIRPGGYISGRHPNQSKQPLLVALNMMVSRSYSESLVVFERPHLKQMFTLVKEPLRLVFIFRLSSLRRLLCNLTATMIMIYVGNIRLDVLLNVIKSKF